MAVILPAKANLAIAKVEQPIIRDGHPVGVATQILEDMLRTAKRRLGVDHPLDLSRRRQIVGERTWNLKRFESVEEA